MKKAFGIGILVIGLSAAAFLGCRIWWAQDAPGDDALRDNAKMVSAESIFTDDNVVDLGNHAIAYLVPNDTDITDAYGSYLNDFAGDHYIAVQVFYMNSYHDNRDDIVYIPDIYENITEIRLEGSNELYIQYVDADGKRQEVCLPIGFVSRIENSYADILRLSDHYCRKLVWAEQEGLRPGEAVLPRTAWTETFWAEEQQYEITFERISLIYEFELETGGIFADYNLIVKDGNGDVIYERLFLNYPVVYEAAHWLVDFSGDGFMDIAIAYNEGWGREVSDHLYTLIWNPQKMQYEYKQSPITSKVENPYPLWNEELACWIEFADRDREGRLIMDMYSFVDGGWKRVRRLQAVYAENEYTADGEPVYLGYQEIFYSEDGEVLEVKKLENNPEVYAVWFDAESIWSRFNTDNLKLYLAMPDWELVETDLCGKKIPLWVAQSVEAQSVLYEVTFQIGEGYETKENEADLPYICRTDYTQINYADGFYYYQSAADHLYLYRMEENDMQPECLVEDVVKELYVLGDWVYFTNLSRDAGLYRVKTDGSGLEAVCEEAIDRFLPFRGAFYCLSEWEEGINRVFVCTVDGEIKTLFEGKCYWISTDGELLYADAEEADDEKRVSFSGTKLIIA